MCDTIWKNFLSWQKKNCSLHINNNNKQSLEHKFNTTSLSPGVLMPDNAMQRKIAIQLVSVEKTNHFIRWIVLSTFPTTTRVRSNQLTLLMQCISSVLSWTSKTNCYYKTSKAAWPSWSKPLYKKKHYV